MAQSNLAVDIDFQFPAKPKPLTSDQRAQYKESIKRLLKEKNAVLVAHYYTDPEIQALAEETGGCVADSLEMARFGNQHSADMLIVAGVRFMGETAKVLTPEKTVVMPTLEATCSLDLAVQSSSLMLFVINTLIAQSWYMPIPQQPSRLVLTGLLPRLVH